MTQNAPPHDVSRWVPAFLSFAAGYIDSYTFLALFGLFVHPAWKGALTRKLKAARVISSQELVCLP